MIVWEARWIDTDCGPVYSFHETSKGAQCALKVVKKSLGDEVHDLEVEMHRIPRTKRLLVRWLNVHGAPPTR